jgi:hypothetical protein
MAAVRPPQIHPRARQMRPMSRDMNDLSPETYVLRPDTPTDQAPETDSELLKAYPIGEAPGVPDWQVLLTAARERVDLMDTSLLDLVSVPGVIELLAANPPR